MPKCYNLAANFKKTDFLEVKKKEVFIINYLIIN